MAALGYSMLSAGAAAQSCVSASSPARLESDATGTYCSVSVTAYQHFESCNGTVNNHIAVSGDLFVRPKTGQTYGILCAADFNAATADAGRYFALPNNGGYPFRITIPAGTYYVADSGNTPNNAVIALPVTTQNISSPVSAKERLIITGATSSNGTNLTTLLSNWNLATLVARPANNTINPQSFSHLTVENIDFDRDQFAVSQSETFSIVSVSETVTTTTTGGKTSNSVVKSTAMEVILSLATTGWPGFNTPDFNFQAAPVPPTPQGNAGFQQYVRLYDNVIDRATGVRTPMLDAAVNGSVNSAVPSDGVFNPQIFVHGVCGGAIAAPLDDYAISSNGTTSTAHFSCPTSGNTYTLLLGSNPGPLSQLNAQAIASYANIPATARPLVCLKNEGSTGNVIDIDNQQAIDPNTGAATPGSDIVLSHLTLRGAARASIQNTTAVSILNVTVAREPPLFGQAPCLSSDAGGFQIIGTPPLVTYGNMIDGLSSTATGDDSLAIFGDTGGINGTPVTVVTNTVIRDSFARGIFIVPPASQPATDAYLSNVDAYPYAGFTLQNAECSGNGASGEPGFSLTRPSGSCDFPAGSNSISDIYTPCADAANSATNNDVFCPVNVQLPSFPASISAAAAAPALATPSPAPLSRTTQTLVRVRLSAPPIGPRVRAE